MKQSIARSRSEGALSLLRLQVQIPTGWHRRMRGGNTILKEEKTRLCRGACIFLHCALPVLPQQPGGSGQVQRNLSVGCQVRDGVAV